MLDFSYLSLIFIFFSQLLNLAKARLFTNLKDWFKQSYC